MALLFLRATDARSKICVPLFNVCKKLSSSETLTDKIRFLSVTSSGYCGPMAPIAATVSSDMIGSIDPRRRIFRIVLRIIRRKT